MKFFWPLVLAFPLAAANVPNRYIVELSTEPVAASAGQLRLIHGPAAERRRNGVRSEQASARSRIQQAEGAVLGSVENVGNALIVQIDDAKANRLAALPGVRRVYPVRTFRLNLDHALPLHHVPEAWTQVGIANAGAGARIAIIDTGVDISHPGFQDANFTAPNGFPRGDPANTNNKVIVARRYVGLLPNRDPDLSASDHVGHGTAIAMAAAGVRNTGPLAIISGVAPSAYIGSYKVFGTPTVNPGPTEDVVLRAIDDAVADGMDILNLSLSWEIALLPADDFTMRALEYASGIGVVVVCSAGNNGSEPMTVASPAASPSVISVGATANDRIFSARVFAGDQQYQAIPGAGPAPASAITGMLAGVSTLDGDGFGCSGLPAGSLEGKIAFVSRGNCTFELKLNNAQAAGAIGAIVSNNVDGPPLIMGVNSATLPAEMISQSDGAALGRQIANGISITMDFTAGPVYSDPSHLESFSSIGPNVDFSIKPDLVAVGGNVYVAAEKMDPRGAVYDPSGYAIEAGTSFSAPLVAGAAALLKSARPGLSAAQYRSLLVNTADTASSAPGSPAHVQQAGAGLLNVLAAVNATAAFAPVSLSFGADVGTVSATRQLTLWNLGTESDTFQLSVSALGGNAVPELPYASLQLDPGASATIPVSFPVDGLAPGEYEGFIQVQGTRSNVTSRVPYWRGVTSGQPRHITVLANPGAAAAGSTIFDGLLFRITDESGIPLMNLNPAVRALSGGGDANNIRLYGAPYLYDASLRLGSRPGANVFRIQVGDLTKDVTIIGQ